MEFIQRLKSGKKKDVTPDSTHPERILAKVAHRFGRPASQQRREFLAETSELFETVLEPILSDFGQCFVNQAEVEIDPLRIAGIIEVENQQDLIAGIYQQDLVIAALTRLVKANRMIRNSMLDELQKRVAADKRLPAKVRRSKFELHLARGLVLTCEDDAPDAAEHLLESLLSMTDWPQVRLEQVARGEPIRELAEIAESIEDVGELAAGIARLILAGRDDTRDTLRRIPCDRRLARAVAEHDGFDPCLVRYALLSLRRMVRCDAREREQGELF